MIRNVALASDSAGGKASGRHPRARSRRGDGSIYPFRDGWRASVDVGLVDGRRRREIFFAKTRADVHEQLVAALAARNRGLLAKGRKQTLKDFLTDWIEKADVRPLTRIAYRQKMERHIIPTLGHVRLNKLTAQRIDGLFEAKKRELVTTNKGKPTQGRRTLSAQSVAHIRSVLRAALNRAVKYELIARNPVELTDPVKVARYEATYLTAEEARRLLAAADGDRLEALYTVACALGLRQGEALGLRWSDVDLDAKTLRVARSLERIPGKGLELVEPKTKSSRRTLGLPEVVIRALRAHRVRQVAERIGAGDLWQDHDLIFTTLEGRPLSASHVVAGSFRPIVRRAGLPERLRFHDLRHSAATLLLAQGVPQRVVMEQLGHTTLAMTQRYMHVVPQLMRDAAAGMDRALGS